MNKKRKKRLKNQNARKKTYDVQNMINTFRDFANIPQLNDDNIDYYLINDTTGYDTVISSKINLIENGLSIKTDNLIGKNLLKDIFNKTLIVKIFPNINQKKILLNWMNAYIDMYNQIISKIKTIRKQYNEQYNKVFKYNEIEFNLNLNELKKDFFNYKDKLNKKTKINKHILDYAIKDALTSLESSITNLKEGNTKKSRLRYLKKSKTNKIIKIENEICSKNSICSSILGKQLNSSPVINYENKIEKASILKYDVKTDKFILYIKKGLEYDKTIKEKIKENNMKVSEKIGCFDIGLRTFLSGITNDHTIEYGLFLNKKIKKILIKMDKIKNKKMVKNKKEYIKKNLIKKNIIKNKRKHLLKYEKYLTNYINNVHWQIANDMTKRFDHIILGNFSTKNMVESNSTSKMNKRIANALKLYQFKQRLKYKCLLKNIKYTITNEYMTTKCCSNCSKVNYDIKDKKEFICKNCDHEYDRDINAAKNILMKSFKITYI